MLEACRYEDIAKHSKVFNLSTLDYHLWIYLNPEYVRDTYFIKSEEIGPSANNSTIFPDTFKRDSQCWIRANLGYLNLNPGKHTYRLFFVNRYTDTDFSLYVSYYIQDDNPDKPYVYVKHSKDDSSGKPTILPQTQFTEYKD